MSGTQTVPGNKFFANFACFSENVDEGNEKRLANIFIRLEVNVALHLGLTSI